MKKIIKIVLSSILAISAFVGMIFTRNTVKNVSAQIASVPDGKTLDTTFDELSVSDLTIDGKTGQTIIAKNENQNTSYTATDAEKSLVFKFKYDVYDATKSEKNAVRVHFFYNDGKEEDPKWCTGNCLWIRGDKVYLASQREGSYGYESSPALAKGMHDVEFGRLAILNEGVATGTFYCYAKIDGVEVSSAVNTYDDASKFQDTMFFNFSAANLYNKVYDANLTYEDPQYISVSNLTNGTVLSHKANVYEYNMTNAPANKSVAFVAKWVNKVDDYVNFYIGGPGSFNNGSKDVEYNWYDGGCVSPRQDGIYFYKTDSEGYSTGASFYKYPSALEIGNDKAYFIEYGRKAIMNGSNFTGKYHVYYKIDGKLIYAVDQKLLDGVAAGGYFRIGNFDNDVVDAYYQETPKVISVSDLTYQDSAVGDSLVMDAQRACSYTNTDHAENYSLVFKCFYEVNAAEEHQFHFNNDNWGHPSSFIIKGSTVHLGQEPTGYGNINLTLSNGIHEVEFGRLANMRGVEFLGDYYVYLKIDGVVVKYYTQTLSNTIVSSNNAFITGSSGKVNKIYDINSSSISKATAPSFTTVKDGTQVQIDPIYEWKTNEAIIEFDSSYPNVLIDLRQFGNTGTRCSDQYTSNYSSFIIANPNNYYHHVVDISSIGVKSGFTGSETISAIAFRGAYDYANLVVKDNAMPTYFETPDVISVGDLYKDGVASETITLTEGSATYGDTIYSYNATAEHKSVVYKFNYEVVEENFGTEAFSCQFHFSDERLNEGVVWLRGDKNYLQTNSGYLSTESFSKVGTYLVEIGKLYYSSGDNQGKYYIYLKVNGVLNLEYVINTLPDKANLRTTGKCGNHMYEINPTVYEKADAISISDLKDGGANISEEIKLNAHQTYTYDSTVTNKSVSVKFLYYTEDASKIDCQVHFKNGWLEDNGGVIWLRGGDKNNITLVGGKTYTWASSNKWHNGYNEVEIGKVYATSGRNVGKCRVYVKVNGQLDVELTLSMPDSNAIYLTGTNGDYFYDINYMPVELDSSLYVYEWDVNKSGIAFAASLQKALVDYNNLSNVGFVLYQKENPSNAIKVAGKLVEDGNKYYVKAALLGLAEADFAKDYAAKLYYVMPDGKEYYSDSVYTSLYDQLGDLTGYEAYATALNALKAKVLDVHVDEDTLDVVGANKSLDGDNIVLTGANANYSSFIVNGNALDNNEIIKIGYNQYAATLGTNSITLVKLAHSIMYGGSEHFVEINSGHDEDMTAANLAPMTSELGLESVRLDIYFSSIFTVLANDELKVNYGEVAKVQGVIDELKANGGVTDFLAVLWTVLPNGYKKWTNAPWETQVIPNPETESEAYLRWLKLNGEAARLCAELFPDVHNFETKNEAEMIDENAVNSKMIYVTVAGTDPVVATAHDYSVAQKAKILTDLMYYFNKGIKEANPENVLTTNSICCATTAETSFAVPSIDFLEEMYKAIKDGTPVTGYTANDTDANNYFDVINIHPYLISGVTTSNWTAFVQSFSTLAAKYDDAGTEVWVTEFGFAQNRYSTAQADMLEILDQAQDIDCLTRFYFYKVHDYTNKIDSDRWGIYNYDGTIKAIGTAVKAVINPAV